MSSGGSFSEVSLDEDIDLVQEDGGGESGDDKEVSNTVGAEADTELKAGLSNHVDQETEDQQPGMSVHHIL